MKIQDLRKIIREETRKILKEAEIIPIGPDGQQITDPKVIKNLNTVLKLVSGPARSKLIQLITDPAAAKDLKSADQKAAIISAIAISFGISEQEFTQIVGKIKSVLPDAKPTGPTEPQL